VFGTALLPFFQLRSSSTVPNTSSSTNSAPKKRGAGGQLHVFLGVPQGVLHQLHVFLWSSTCSTNSTVELLHGGVRGAELEKREQSSPKHPLHVMSFEIIFHKFLHHKFFYYWRILTKISLHDIYFCKKKQKKEARHAIQGSKGADNKRQEKRKRKKKCLQT
jgi:hypothetical protein